MGEFNGNYYPPVSELIKMNLESFFMTQKELAMRLNVTEKHISKLLNNQVHLTLELALGLEKVFSVPVDIWMNYEYKNREFMLRKKQIEEIEISDMEKIKNDFQLDFLIKKKWLDVNPDMSLAEKINALYHYLGVRNINAFYQYYNGILLNSSFKEEAVQIEPLAVWLCRCEKEIEKVNQESSITEYSKEKFEISLEKIKTLLTKTDEKIFAEVKELCYTAGVYFIRIEPVPNSGIQAAIIWYGNNPAIQMILCDETYDHFWFSFFHEAGHVLLHPSKGKELIECNHFRLNLSKAQEKEADDFASEMILPNEQYLEFLANHEINKNSILDYSNKHHIAPALLVGRLQQDRRIHSDECNDLKVRYTWE